MADNPRIEELRRRVEADPASIAFAALAEEYRRSGAHQDAIDTCRTGLQRHPSYLSARVTLGRALIEIGDYDGARQELETVLKSAPENLAATRAMAEIQERTGHVQEQTPPPARLAVSAPSPAPAASIGLADWKLPPSPPALPEEPAPQPQTEPPAPPAPVAAPSAPAPPAVADEAVLTRLEALLASIQAARGDGRTR